MSSKADMSTAANEFEELCKHWALSGIGVEELKRAKQLIGERLVVKDICKQIESSPEEDHLEDQQFLERVGFAYEIVVIEGLDALSRPSGDNPLLRNQALLAASKAFDIRRLMPVSSELNERLFFVLKLSSLAYFGGRWSDLRRWYEDNENGFNLPEQDEAIWDSRLLCELFHCWCCLFRKNQRDCLQVVIESIARLREDQEEFEPKYLDSSGDTAPHHIAMRLVALYHWAKATEITALYLMEGGEIPFTELDQHFETAIKVAAAACDTQLEVVVRWLRAAARIMVTGSHGEQAESSI